MLGECVSLSTAPAVLASGRLRAAWFCSCSMRAETPDGSRARPPFPSLSLPPDSASSCPHLSSCCRGSNGFLRHWPLALRGLGLLDWMRALALCSGKRTRTHGHATCMYFWGVPGRRGGLSFRSSPSPSLGLRPSAVMLCRLPSVSRPPVTPRGFQRTRQEAVLPLLPQPAHELWPGHPLFLCPAHGPQMLYVHLL